LYYCVSIYSKLSHSSSSSGIGTPAIYEPRYKKRAKVSGSGKGQNQTLIIMPFVRKNWVVEVQSFPRVHNHRWGERAKMTMQRKSCPNFNHRRTNAPVRFCPLCGAVVNEAILMKECRAENHAMSRRGGTKYCVHCGEQLILARWKLLGKSPGCENCPVRVQPSHYNFFVRREEVRHPLRRPLSTTDERFPYNVPPCGEPTFVCSGSMKIFPPSGKLPLFFPSIFLMDSITA
jgi:hypothetical protein